MSTPFKPETWPVDADGFEARLCTECGTPVHYGSRHTDCGRKAMGLPTIAEANAALSAQPPALSVPAGWAVTYDGKRASYIYADKETAESEALQVGGTARAVAVYLAPPPVRERLTDEQIDAVFMTHAGLNDWGVPYLTTYQDNFRHIARAIERVLIGDNK
jgi:hypothetical protein